MFLEGVEGGKYTILYLQKAREIWVDFTFENLSANVEQLSILHSIVM